VALHGFNDYRASFAELGRYAARRGILVEAYDQPGFGARTDRGSWPGTQALVAALDHAILEVRRRHPGVPLYVLGESMGAAVAMLALARPTAPPVDGLILVAPAVWNGQDLPGTRIAGIAGLVELMGEAQAAATRLELPMLVLLGARDQIVKPQAARRFVATLDPASCSFITYLDGWHLLLRDHQRERVFADLVAWIDRQPLPSRLDLPCGREWLY
jgi:alpha-beta hydrolase superfamily lysophospholipase